MQMRAGGPYKSRAWTGKSPSHTLPLTLAGFTGHWAALPTWWNTFQWIGWPRAITTRRRLRSAQLARIPHRPADLTFPAWCSRARRLLARVTCSPNPKLQSLPSTRRSADSRTPACARLCIQQAVSSLKTNLTLEQRIQLFTHERCVLTSYLSSLQCQKRAGTPPGTRARRLPPSVSPWTRGASWRADHSGGCAQSSARSRSADWRRSSTSTSTWTPGREWRRRRSSASQKHR